MLFEKVNKIDKSLARMTKPERNTDCMTEKGYFHRPHRHLINKRKNYEQLLRT